MPVPAKPDDPKNTTPNRPEGGSILKAREVWIGVAASVIASAITAVAVTSVTKVGATLDKVSRDLVVGDLAKEADFIKLTVNEMRLPANVAAFKGPK